jgi:imidazoleglycerol-phosphate dehydratase
MSARTATVERKTKETEIRIEIDLDGTGNHRVDTPLPFLSHMLDQLGRHGSFDLTVIAKGDVEIDGHHTTEDVGIALGQAVSQALGDRSGIQRYGSATLPMDEACVSCAIDLSGRPFLVFRLPMPKAKVGEFDTELTEVFFDGFVRGAACNLHLHLVEGHVLHHIIEIAFKSFARALRQAVSIDPRSPGVPSTKGVLKE